MSQYRVQVRNGSNWSTVISCGGSEASAMNNAERYAKQGKMVRVLDPKGNVIWCA